VVERASVTGTAEVENSFSLAGQLHRCLALPAAAALGRRLWGTGEVGIRPGVPRAIGRLDLASWLRSDDLMVEFVRVPQDAVSRAYLVIPASDAARWVDRILGGEGKLGRSQSLSPAEAGVLAYALARAVAEFAPAWQVSEVSHASPSRASAAMSRPTAFQASTMEAPVSMVFPLALDTPLGSVDVRWLLTQASAAMMPDVVELRLGLRDQGLPTELEGLASGDLVTSDRWDLTLTPRGLAGRLELTVCGSQERLSCRIEQQRLWVSPSAPSILETTGLASERHPGAERAELILARPRLSQWELSRVASGVALELPDFPDDEVSLVWRGAVVAEGPLIWFRGSAGMRVRQLTSHSMR
jgi:hypothetical protein